MPDYFRYVLYTNQILWIVWIIIWFTAAFFTKRTVYRQSRRNRFLFLIVLVAAIALMQSHRFHAPFFHNWLFPPTPATCIAGSTLTALGLLFACWARYHLGRNWSGLITLKENHELIQTGPYALARHPIYTGVMTAVIGSVLALTPTLAGLLVIAAIGAAFTIKLRGEEQLMNQQFPDAYPAYKKKVRGAIIPWIL